MSIFEPSKFSPSPDPEFICGICMNVLNVPVETPCQHVFCSECIKKALIEKSKCPVCRRRCKCHHVKNVLPLLQNLINKLTMKCENSDNGCTELIMKEYYLEHVKSCQFVMVQCRYKDCGQQFLKKDIEEHETRICLFREQTCVRGCGLVVTWAEKESHDCMTALLAMVKDLKDKNSDLEKKIGDLNSIVTGLTRKLEDYETNNERNQRSNSDSEEDSRSRSRSRSPRWNSWHSFNTRSASPQNRSPLYSGSSVISPTYSLSSDTADNAESQDLITTSGQEDTVGHQAIDNTSRDLEHHLDGRNETIISGHIENSSDAFNVGVSGNWEPIEILSSSGCQEENKEAVLTENDDTQSRGTDGGDTALPSSTRTNDCSNFILGISGNIVASEACNSHENMWQPGKRQYEENEDEARVCGRQAKQAKINSFFLKLDVDEDSERASYACSSSSPQSSHGECAGNAKKHPSGHKNTKSEASSSSQDVMASPGHDHTSTSAATPEERCLTPDSPQEPRPDHPVTRRSARLNNKAAMLQESVIRNVKVPPSTAYLLSRNYEEDSSDDESWSPSKED